MAFLTPQPHREQQMIDLHGISQESFDLTAERLRQLLSYDPETGIFRWLVKPSKRVQVGAIAGCIDAKGYLIIKIEGKCHKAHRLAWLYMMWHWPVNLVDHKDRDPGNCRWQNLREATFSQNNINSKKVLGRSGLRGVAWSENARKWKSSIRVSGKRMFLGYFDDPVLAHSVYQKAAERFHNNWRPCQ